MKQVKGRWYWDPPDRLRRSHNLKTVSLGADQAAAWAYARRLNKDHLSLGEGEAPVGTVAWMIEAFLSSDRFNGLAESTRRDYRWLGRDVLAKIEVPPTTLGSMPAMSIKPRHADFIYTLIRDERGPSTAHYACRFARRLWHWGGRREIVGSVNPWSGMELQNPKARTALWTSAQVAAVVAQAEKEGYPSIGLATLLAYWLGHRQADILALTWTALDAGLVETRKTNRVLPIDVSAYPLLQEALQGTKRSSTHVVVYEGTRRPYNKYTFGHLWRAVATRALIPKALQFRDLRATAITELSDAGADVIELSTHSGHETVAMARRYARRTPEQFRRAAKKRAEGRNEG
ncbi:tyrosine-type recombinase/integrase [Gluconacetobacter diazotrophicus]|uniref:Tyrosine-type recombinase/integrase n=1 Tax=Gluconacetobacter diazotrophicus TaxID=33996 RepID=A0A7W4I685_GLUDI|nr:tyrosine-type recombinase/integrase [Gluconacetobacter diazotrophicus]MBB2157023.1 tyrosine-type recombinase/integrase [Gluconacetobacter diazotrophicus]